MSAPDAPRPADVGEYCRRVERHLTRVNGGHLVRIVGPAFDLVRRWAVEGIPLSIVYGGIDRKAERHRHGAARRPLRVEFCEADVRALFDDWRRAVGVPAAEGSSGTEPDGGRRRPSLGRHLQRAAARLERAMTRADCPPVVAEALAAIGRELAGLGGEGPVRGAERERVEARLETLDGDLLALGRQWAEADLPAVTAEAEADLDPYRARLAPDAWQRSVRVTVDRLLRDRLQLPTLTLR